MSAIEDTWFSKIAAASIFLAELKALAVFLSRGVNNLNAWEDSATAAPLAAALPRADPALSSPALAILPLTIAPTAKPEFLISLSNKKLVVSQLVREYHSASFSACV